MSDEVDDVCSDEVTAMDVSPTVEAVESAEVEDVNIAIVVVPVVVLGMSDKVEDTCSGEVSGVDDYATVEAVESAEVEDVNIAIVVDPVVVLGK